jgi:hypothetical protein
VNHLIPRLGCRRCCYTCCCDTCCCGAALLPALQAQQTPAGQSISSIPASILSLTAGLPVHDHFQSPYRACLPLQVALQITPARSAIRAAVDRLYVCSMPFNDGTSMGRLQGALGAHRVLCALFASCVSVALACVPLHVAVAVVFFEVPLLCYAVVAVS